MVPVRLVRLYQSHRRALLLLAVLIGALVLRKAYLATVPHARISDHVYIDDSVEREPPNLDVIPSVHDAYTLPLKLPLDLPKAFLENPIMDNQQSCIKQYGFNLKLR